MASTIAHRAGLCTVDIIHCHAAIKNTTLIIQEKSILAVTSYRGCIVVKNICIAFRTKGAVLVFHRPLTSCNIHTDVIYQDTFHALTLYVYIQKETLFTASTH